MKIEIKKGKRSQTRLFNESWELEKLIEKSNKEIIKDFEGYLDDHSYASELKPVHSLILGYLIRVLYF